MIKSIIFEPANNIGGPPLTINTGIYLYNNVEVLDFSGPFEVFSTASRIFTRNQPDAEPLFNVFTIAETTQPKIARGGLKICPEYSIAEHPKIDLLIIPGGVVTKELANNQTISWIIQCSGRAQLTASVCTGAFLLAKAGLLQNRKATTHFEDIPDLEKMFPDIDVQHNTAWVDEKDVVTSAGISAGIDMSLYLVSKLADPTLALATARQMEYNWIYDTDH
jgi:transcriptional regulator GlxA family with amidase domain